MNLFFKARKSIAYATLILTLMLSGSSPLRGVDVTTAEASSISVAAGRYRVVWYYSDASYTTRVGIGTFQCNGRATLSGRSTSFSVEVANEPCCGNYIC